MFPPSNADLFTAATDRGLNRCEGVGHSLKRCRRTVGTGLLIAGLVVAAGCGKQTTATPPPSPVRAQPSIEPIERPTEPVWESQTQVTLPAPQPVPAEAASIDPPPLRIDRSEPPGNEQPGLLPDPAQPATGRDVPGGAEPAAHTPFRLGQILSAEQRHLYNSMIDQDLRAAEQSLARLLRSGGLQERSTQVRRVRAFIAQAEEVRNDDLPLAQNLAGRARLLAEDLAGSTPNR